MSRGLVTVPEWFLALAQKYLSLAGTRVGLALFQAGTRSVDTGGNPIIHGQLSLSQLQRLTRLSRQGVLNGLAELKEVAGLDRHTSFVPSAPSGYAFPLVKKVDHPAGEVVNKVDHPVAHPAEKVVNKIDHPGPPQIGNGGVVNIVDLEKPLVVGGDLSSVITSPTTMRLTMVNNIDYPSALPSLDELNAALAGIPSTSDRYIEHELVKEALCQLALSKKLVPKPELPVPGGRLDVAWADDGGELLAAFEIDLQEVKGRSLAKLQALSCSGFIITRHEVGPSGLRENSSAQSQSIQSMLEDLAELGAADPRQFLDRFPSERVGAWVAWMLKQPAGRFRNPAGYIFRKLEENKEPPAAPDPVRVFTRGKYGHAYRH